MEEKRRKPKYKLRAEIVDREKGMQYFEDIRMIRLKSRNHNLLIMEDYMPIIGEVTGFVQFISDDGIISFDSIHGFYMHKRNKFSLLIESYGISEEEQEDE